MATTYLSPGVYVEEIDKGTKPIEVLGASMPAFIGVTAQASAKDPLTGAPLPDELVLDKATLVTNWTQFQTYFGGFVKGAFLPEAVYGYFSNGGGSCYVTSLHALHESGPQAEVTIPAKSGPKSRPPAKKGNKDDANDKAPEVKNGSFRLVARVGGSYGNEIRATILLDRDDTGKETGTFKLILNYPTLTGYAQEEAGNIYTKQGADGLQLFRKFMHRGQEKEERVVFKAVEITDVTDAPPIENPPGESYELAGGGAGVAFSQLAQDQIIGDEAQRTGLAGLAAKEDVRLVLCPDLMPDADFKDLDEDARSRIKNVQQAMIAHCERLKYRFAILDTPRGLNAQQAREWRFAVNYDSSYAALYYPWIVVPDLSGDNGRSKRIPPSGYMAGVYNRVDGERGVHKAPANEILQGVTGLELTLTKGEQDTLNPIGVNCIRTFPGRGIRCWGGRTLSSDGSWRYINVRRLFITVGASLDTGLQWVVFEPNDRTLWARVRRDINAFIGTFWLSGALFGSTKGEAFYVKCDDELNPPAIRDLGQLIIEVGLAPVKPAEFVILRLSQWAGPNAESE
jgi:uncharacterized protein